MHVTSPQFQEAANAPDNEPAFTVGISWKKDTDPASQPFTIGVSTIGGPDRISGGGDIPTLLDAFLYDDESDYINTITIDRTISAIPFGVLSAQLDIELDNTSKRFLPNYDPDIGSYIKVGRPIRVGIGLNKEVLPQFSGFTGRPQITLGDRRVNIHAYDAMAYLNDFESNLGIQTNISLNDMLALWLQEAGYAPNQYTLESSLQEPLAFVVSKGKKIGSMIREAVEAEMGVFFIDEIGRPKFWNRYHFNNNSGPVSTLSYDNTNDMKYVDTPVINFVRVISNPRSVRDNQPVFILAGAIQVDPGMTVTFPGGYTDEDGELPVIDVDAPIASSTTINESYYTANTQADGEGSDAFTDTVMSNFESFGNVFFVDFTNTGVGPVYISDMRIYGRPAKVRDHIVEEYKDQDSIDENGLNPNDGGEIIEIRNDYIQDGPAAKAFATNMVFGYKQPRRQLTMPVFPNPSYQFGDVVSVEIEDTGETLTCIIMGNVIGMSRDTIIYQDVTVEERDFTAYFTIGQSIIGGSDIIAP